MAVLGAKRPQDRGWQWVVFSLWIVLLVPALQAVAARSSGSVELFAAWQFLLAALISMGLLNYLPTRYALAAMLLAAGQLVLLRPYLLAVADEQSWRTCGVALLGAATAATWFTARRAGVPSLVVQESSAMQRVNERWFHFRDRWGAFWGLRILQRVNQTAELGAWPVRLEWGRGFVPAAGPTQEGVVAGAVGDHTLVHMHQTLDSLLRRFDRFERP
jgi:hypothetical protein